MKVLALPLASRLHGENYYRGLMRIYKDCLEGYDGVIVSDYIFTSAEELSIDLESPDLLLLIHLTGGTSGLAKIVVERSGKPAILVAHGHHNSLPSALSARAWIVHRGYRARIIYSDKPSGFCKIFNSVYRGLLAGYSLSRLRVLEINDDGVLSDGARRFSEALGAVVKAVSYRDIMDAGSKASDRELNDLINHISKHIDLSGISYEDLYKVIRIYYAIRKIIVEKGFNAVSIDCFPLILEYRITPCLAIAMLNNDGIPAACEDDFYSLALLVLGPILSGEPGWISNPSGLTSEGYIKFAHCTIAPRLGSNCMLVSHFESGYPYAIACRLKHREYALLRISLDYRQLHVFRAKNIESGLLEPGLCRTQLIASLHDLGGREFIEYAQGNHHVAIPWVDDMDEMLKTVSWLMNWDLVMHG